MPQNPGLGRHKTKPIISHIRCLQTRLFSWTASIRCTLLLRSGLQEENWRKTHFESPWKGVRTRNGLNSYVFNSITDWAVGSSCFCSLNKCAWNGQLGIRRGLMEWPSIIENVAEKYSSGDNYLEVSWDSDYSPETLSWL